MRKLGMFVATVVLASSAWAQQINTQAGAQTGTQKSGTERSRGVVTGGTGDGGIALHSDQAKGQTGSSVSGGVSVNARDNMRAQTPPHNLKMVFALNTGNYVSDVQVKVTDKSGKVVLQDVSNGPWLFATLPAGSYTATATYNGTPVTQKVTVAKGSARNAQFRWPASVEGQAVGAAATDAGGQILGTGPQEPQQR